MCIIRIFNINYNSKKDPGAFHTEKRGRKGQGLYRVTIVRRFCQFVILPDLAITFLTHKWNRFMYRKCSAIQKRVDQVVDYGWSAQLLLWLVVFLLIDDPVHRTKQIWTTLHYHSPCITIYSFTIIYQSIQQSKLITSCFIKYSQQSINYAITINTCQYRNGMSNHHKTVSN